ncbi:hypothetical protein [Parasediminibacterium sp. JCM 36343]|uniref:hypothetical protein n=1 Tax=Parasediminibacterium sp. JCM 36343 TaxID=3374279 RepID=UPI00397DE749
MKFSCLCALVIIGFVSFSFSNAAVAQTMQGCDSTPQLNKQVIAFVNSKMGKQVGRGECWDLAAEPLNLLGANWNKQLVYGRQVDYEKECVYPGDMMQFEGVTIKYTTPDRVKHIEKMEHHTAIVYEVKGKGYFIIAHQNTGMWGRKVGTSELDLQNITKGRFTIFRPYK